MKYLIVGLGNIGPEYHETRHNIGFMAVDALAKAAGCHFYRRTLWFHHNTVSQGTPTVTAEAFHLYEPQRQRRTLLDAKGKHSIGECVGSGR